MREKGESFGCEAHQTVRVSAMILIIVFADVIFVDDTDEFGSTQKRLSQANAT